MRKIYRLRTGFICLITLLLNLSPLRVLATGTAPQMAAPAGLSIAELKVTGDEFVVIQNNTGRPIADLSSYWLYVYNKTNPATSGASSSGQQLPVGTLDSGQTILLSDKARATCGAQIAGSLSLSLGDANGYLQILQQTTVNSVLAQTPGDFVSWGTDGNNSGIISKMPSNTTDPAAMFYRAAGGWQLADLDTASACQLNAIITSGGTTTKQPVSALSSSSVLPPATIVSLDNTASETDAPVLPPADMGLSAPSLPSCFLTPAARAMTKPMSS